MDTEHGQEQNQEKYSFMQESIKDEEVNGKKVLKKVAGLVGKGLLFGVAASLGFFALKPWAETIFQKDPNKVEIPQDDELEETVQSEPEEVTSQVLTVEDYRDLNEVLIQVAAEAEKSVVLMTGIQQDEGWLTEQDSAAYQTSGLIVADNGRELLILANYSDMKDAQLFQAKFADGSVHEAVMKQKDGNINLAVFSVAKSSISEKAWESIKVAELGNSNVLKQGRVMIALGSPFGVHGGIGYGAASSVDETINLADGQYDILITDLPNAEKNSGILFDTYGRVMGIINHELAKGNEVSTLTALGISTIKSEIELMSNGKHVPYVGVHGTIVTEEISEVQNIPAGLYVTEVEVDSPAMKAGIQSGDVITEVSGKEITTYAEYHKAVIGQEAGKSIQVIGQRYGAEKYVGIKFNVTVGIKQ